jgi:hypothetical protein
MLLPMAGDRQYVLFTLPKYKIKTPIRCSRPIFRARALRQTTPCIKWIREAYVKENHSVTARDRVRDLGPGSGADRGTNWCNWISGRADTDSSETGIADCDAVAIADSGADSAARRTAESNANSDRVTDADGEAVSANLYVAVSH